MISSPKARSVSWKSIIWYLGKHEQIYWVLQQEVDYDPALEALNNIYFLPLLISCIFLGLGKQFLGSDDYGLSDSNKREIRKNDNLRSHLQRTSLKFGPLPLKLSLLSLWAVSYFW